MTYEETQQILKVLRANYPHSFKNMSKEETFNFLDLWSEAFKDDPAELVAAAVKSIIYGDVREFAPNIGQVKNKMQELMNPNQMTEQEAFERIRKACSNSNYHAQEEYDKLPPTLKRIAGSPSQLKNWASMDSDTFNSVVASNIQRSYKVIAKQEKEQKMLPNDIKMLLEGFADTKRINQPVQRTLPNWYTKTEEPKEESRNTDEVNRELYKTLLEAGMNPDPRNIGLTEEEASEVRKTVFKHE